MIALDVLFHSVAIATISPNAAAFAITPSASRYPTSPDPRIPIFMML
ncbi:MAG TPA: hypothetical protein VFH09_01845 [Nitrososphaera sp.]|nr:hypothetical protein [Nitrososphaera sp.]